MPRIPALALPALLSCVLSASIASAALNVSSPQSGGVLTSPNSLITIDIVITTTRPEALALGLRAANFDPAIMTLVGATVPSSIFDFAPSIPFGGIVNTASGEVQAPLAGVRAGWSVNLFQGIALTPAAGSGPETFQLQFLMGQPGLTQLDSGAFAAYSDVYVGGDDVVNATSISIFNGPEPTTAVLLGLGLAALSSTRPRRD